MLHFPSFLLEDTNTKQDIFCQTCSHSKPGNNQFGRAGAQKGKVCRPPPQWDMLESGKAWTRPSGNLSEDSSSFENPICCPSSCTSCCCCCEGDNGFVPPPGSLSASGKADWPLVFYETGGKWRGWRGGGTDEKIGEVALRIWPRALSNVIPSWFMCWQLGGRISWLVLRARGKLKRRLYQPACHSFACMHVCVCLRPPTRFSVRCSNYAPTCRSHRGSPLGPASLTSSAVALKQLK